MDYNWVLIKFRDILNREGVDLSRRNYDKLLDKPISSKALEKKYGTWNKAKRLALGIESDNPKENFKKNNNMNTSVKREFKGDSAVITTKSLHIKTEPEALKYAEMDLKKWKPVRSKVNSWEVTMGKKNTNTGKPETYTNWQVTVWLERRKIDHEEFANELIKKMQEHSPSYPKINYDKFSEDKVMIEFDLFDIHHGKLAWGKETDTDFDIKISRKIINNAVEDLIVKTQHYNPELILLPLGNDLINIDNLEGKTTFGTAQDSDTRPLKIFTDIFYILIETIDKLSNIAPVDILMIPGNHDRQSVFYIGLALEAWYRKCDYVNIDNSPKLRKYKRYGSNLLGFVHGGRSDPNMNDLPMIMAAEEPENWAKTTYREWHLGHIHKKKEVRYTAGDSLAGVSIRIVPSLTATDQWHYQHGFVKQIRAAEAFVWYFEGGCVDNFVVFAKE